MAKKPRPKNHPYYAPASLLQKIIGSIGKVQTGILRLPTTRTGPLPSPKLPHNWVLDLELPPFLAPWIIKGICLRPADAVKILIELPGFEETTRQDAPFILGDDANYWRWVAALVVETLAAQKLVPVLALADNKNFHARWMPVLDSPLDGPRLAQLEDAMPPVCRSAHNQSGQTLLPRALLHAFLNTACDALARSWGKQSVPRLGRHDNVPAHRWLEALFSDDPTVEASAAQLDSLVSSYRSWMRNLEAAGDAAFKIAFRLESPHQKVGPESPSKQTSDWKIHYLLQARDDPSLLVSADDVWKTRGSVLTQLQRRFEQPQEKLLAGLGYAARLFPPIAESLKKKRPTYSVIDSQAAYDFLRQVAPVLEGAGFGLLAPPWWNKPGARLGVRLRLKPPEGTSSEVISRGKLSLENLVDYRWELALGETTLTEAEFRSLAALKTPLVQIRGQWVQLDPEQIEAAIHFWKKQEIQGQMSLLEAARLGLDNLAMEKGIPIEQVTSEGWVAEWLERFKQSETLTELPQPSGLVGELRPYQRYGFSWLSFHRNRGIGACLADDMGLGKTIQTIALLLKEKEELGRLPAPALLVCPTSVVTNWEREIRRFAPSLSTLVHQGADRFQGEHFNQAAHSVDIVLTSYALVRNDTQILQGVEWLGVILDEAQNIKNPSARQTQAVRQLTAGFRLALTGTPVENRLSELWSIMHFLNPGYLGSREKFRSDFALPVERYNDEKALQRLKGLINPFILRRVKTDPRVIQDLPEKVETKVYCRLTEEQATLYEAVVQDTLQQIEEKEGIQRRGLVLSMLMQLKQICNHPLLYLHQGKSERAGDHIVSGRSGKFERLTEILEEILGAGDRLLIFTQFAEMGHILASFLPKATGAAAQFLHGGTPANARDYMVRRFQEDDYAPPIFILSLKAGGTGLNLTRANHVVHFDRWWNPAVEDQATDRAFRIGQQRNVQVHKFVTTGTMEEMIDDLIESKKGLTRAVIGSGENWLTELSTHDLRQLIQYRRV